MSKKRIFLHSFLNSIVVFGFFTVGVENDPEGWSTAFGVVFAFYAIVASLIIAGLIKLIEKILNKSILKSSTALILYTPALVIIGWIWFYNS